MKDEGEIYSWNDREPEVAFHTRRCKLVECRPARVARQSCHADEISDLVKAKEDHVYVPQAQRSRRTGQSWKRI